MSHVFRSAADALLVSSRDARAGMAAIPRRRAEDRQFALMESIYRQRGGLASGDEFARMLRRRSTQPLSELARWVVDREIVSFHWRSSLLIPMFQFEEIGMHPRPAVVDVANELSPFLDDWQSAWWFTAPNVELGLRAPVDVIDVDPLAVRRVARAERMAAA